MQQDIVVILWPSIVHFQDVKTNQQKREIFTSILIVLIFKLFYQLHFDFYLFFIISATFLTSCIFPLAATINRAWKNNSECDKKSFFSILSSLYNSLLKSGNISYNMVTRQNNYNRGYASFTAISFSNNGAVRPIKAECCLA